MLTSRGKAGPPARRSTRVKEYIMRAGSRRIRPGVRRGSKSLQAKGVSPHHSAPGTLRHAHHAPVEPAHRPGGSGPMETAQGGRKRLRVAIGLTGLILIVEAVCGWYANSIALLSDAVHVLTDLGSLGLTYAALVLAARPATARKTWGWYRLEILAALVNGAVLLALAAGLFIESVRRIGHPPEVLAGAMSLGAVIGLAGNLISMAVLAGGRGHLCIRGAWLHVASDALSSVGVLLAATLLALT